MIENNLNAPGFFEKEQKQAIPPEDSGEILELTEILQPGHNDFKAVAAKVEDDFDQPGSDAFAGEENRFEDTADIIEDDGIDLTILKLESLEKQIEQLSNEFKSKLKYDAHKEKIIDHLRKEFKGWGLAFRLGGQISIDVTREGWDKSYAFNNMEDYESNNTH